MAARFRFPNAPVGPLSGLGKNAPILGSPLEATNAIWPNEAMKAAGASTEANQEIFMSRRPTKKNPFMSLWLSGANKVAGTGLGLWRATARQQRSAMFRAAGELSASYWNEALKTLSPGKRRPPILKAIPAPSVGGRVIEVSDFGPNPGGLRMFVYAPPKRLPTGAPLIVVLHGCGQNAAAFARDSGWIALAQRIGAALLLPEQTSKNNRGRCFNWFQPGDVRRSSGEAASIWQMVRAAIRRYKSDQRRVFIVGLSAGAAMAAAMLAVYPATFAAGAVVAGMPIGAAYGSASALLRMRRGDWFTSRRLSQRRSVGLRLQRVTHAPGLGFRSGRASATGLSTRVTPKPSQPNGAPCMDSTSLRPPRRRRGRGFGAGYGGRPNGSRSSYGQSRTWGTGFP